MMKLQTSTSLTTKTVYADQINDQFNRSQSHYVNLNQRLQSVIQGQTYMQTVLSETVDDFRERNDHLTKWSDIKLCKAQSTTLDKIAIDITLQRLLMIDWVMDILDNFWAIKVMPICVYEDPNCPGKYICWDGQHSAIMLFIIASLLKEDITKCEVPIVIYPSSKKNEMRQVFMAINGDAKAPLDTIDKFQQMVFGVRTDGATNNDWVVAELKQQYLESAKMFATHRKFNDTGQAGALTVMTELMDTRNYNTDITKYFTQYFTSICRSNRPVQPKESWMIYEYFRLCDQDPSINITPKYVRSVAKALKVVGYGDFDSYALWERAKASYQTYYKKNVRNGLDLLGIRYPEKPLGMTFIIAQVAKAGVKVPKFSGTFNVPLKDLF